MVDSKETVAYPEQRPQSLVEDWHSAAGFEEECPMLVNKKCTTVQTSMLIRPSCTTETNIKENEFPSPLQCRVLILLMNDKNEKRGSDDCLFEEFRWEQAQALHRI